MNGKTWVLRLDNVAYFGFKIQEKSKNIFPYWDDDKKKGIYCYHFQAFDGDEVIEFIYNDSERFERLEAIRDFQGPPEKVLPFFFEEGFYKDFLATFEDVNVIPFEIGVKMIQRL